MKAELVAPAHLVVIPEEVTQRKPHAILKEACKRKPSAVYSFHVNYGSALYKHCADCGEWLPESEFYRNVRRWDGLDYYCKECRDGHSHRV